ncbi:unnamed protein product [Rhizophagus irregularis]|nr:unnamed protein product [Rhizophagus irregularis]CAB5366398.1 unnamed protein product [Rhizophagus irregularis]
MYQTIILGSILLVSFYIFYILKRVFKPKFNMPPLVRYKIPIIGHTYSYTFNSEEFLKQCKKEYGDIFSIYVWGQVRTIVGKEYSQEILSRDDAFNFGKAFFEIIPYDLLLKHIDMGLVNMPKLLKDHIFCKLNFYSERMQKCLHSATQKYIDINVHDDPKVFNNMYPLINKIISTPVANIFIGEEESKYDEVVTTFAEFTSDLSTLIKIPPFLNFFYPGLLNRILVSSGLYNPAIKHRNILIKHIKNQVCKRLKGKAKYGDSWKRPDDLLQDIIEQENIDFNNVNYPSLADKMLLFLFASIHTTSNGCANALMDLASHPQYIQELYEEQLEVHKEADENALDHSVLKDYTFSNGLQLPKDHIVKIYVDDIYQDELLQGPSPKSFEPFRHLDINVPASKIGKNFMLFGGGKHACPGRHFAINEIKFFMHNIILKYNIYTESNKIEGRKMYGPTAYPSSGVIIIEKRRAK